MITGCYVMERAKHMSLHNVVNIETSGDEIYHTLYSSATVTSLSVQENNPKSTATKSSEMSGRERAEDGREEGGQSIDTSDPWSKKFW